MALEWLAEALNAASHGALGVVAAGMILSVVLIVVLLIVVSLLVRDSKYTPLLASIGVVMSYAFGWLPIWGLVVIVLFAVLAVANPFGSKSGSGEM